MDGEKCLSIQINIMLGVGVNEREYRGLSLPGYLHSDHIVYHTYQRTPRVKDTMLSNITWVRGVICNVQQSFHPQRELKSRANFSHLRLSLSKPSRGHEIIDRHAGTLGSRPKKA